MKLRDMKISTQLRLGLAGLALLILAMAALAWYQSDAIWRETEGLYNHPLQVRRAVGSLTADILREQVAMTALQQAQTPAEIEAIASLVTQLDEDAKNQLDAMYVAYLGPRGDLDAIAAAIAANRVVQDETLRLAQSGEVSLVTSRVVSGGTEERSSEAVLDAVAVVSKFALERGDQFYQVASTQHVNLGTQLIIAVALGLLAAVLISWFIMRGIVPPLQELTQTAAALGGGDLGVRAKTEAAPELEVLAVSFNSMADSIQDQVERSERASRVIDSFLAEDEAHAFCQQLLKTLMAETRSQIGAVYIENEAKTALDLFESIGLASQSRESFSITDFEGELGPAIATRTIQHVSEIPPDTAFALAGVSGDFRPRALMTMPIPSDHSVSAVVAFASVHDCDAACVQLLDDVWSPLIARMNGVLVLRNTQRLSEALQERNAELDAQRQELSAQRNELSEQNTELEAQKRELDESNRLKSAFLSNMSHELRTPLNSVIALSGVLGRRLAGKVGEDEHGYLEVIERNGKGLLSLINDILDLSRIEAGKEEINLTTFSVYEVVSEVVETLAVQADERGIGLVNDVAPDAPQLTGDAVKTLHILQNLVGNAVKFTEKGAVTLSAQRQGADILISVTDTGIGISADQLPHVFDEFRQADDSTSRRYGGTGLGLAISRNYAELLSGEITVESTPGVGSVFTLRLPLIVANPEGEGVPTGGGLQSLRGRGEIAKANGELILLVEDSEPAIVQVTDVLTAHGYRIAVARNGREALEQIAEAVPDAMILDLMMPEVDGFDVLDSIRREERTSVLPVLILTAKHVTKEELGFLKKNGIHQLIQKGDIDLDGLLRAVSGMFAPTKTEPAPEPGRGRFPTPGEHRPATADGPKVLIVDDNADNRTAIRAVLGDGYRVFEAQDGRAGLAQARRERPDLILMDAVMPVMDGITALERLRADDALCGIPVLVVTASAMAGDRESLLAIGFDDYISKPIDSTELLDAIANALRGRGPK